MKLRLTIPVADFVKNISPKKRMPRILQGFLVFLEKKFGTQILFDTPPGLQKFPPNLLPALSLASRLEELGIIEKMIPAEKIPDEPFAFHFYAPSATRSRGGGFDLLSQEKAAWKALGEAVERHPWFNSGAFYEKKLVRTSVGKLKGKVMNIFSLAGFSEEQKKLFPNLAFNRDTVFGWIQTQSLTSAEKVWCPAQLFSHYYTSLYVKSRDDLHKNEPMLRWPVTTGLAAGRCLEEATTNGILEVLERDAFMISYLNQISPPVFDLDYLSKQDEDIAKIVRKFRRYNLEIKLLQLPTDFSVFAVAAIIIDKTGLGSAFSLGSSADFDLKTCILDALAEAHVVRISHGHKYKQEVDKTTVNREGRLIYWANPKNFSKIEFFINGPRINVNLEKNFFQEKETDYKKYYTKKLAFLKSELKRLNYRGYVAELTTKPIREIGLSVIHIVIPKLQPMHLDETIPYFSGARLEEIPKKFGYSPKEPVNQEPHPFP